MKFHLLLIAIQMFFQNASLVDHQNSCDPMKKMSIKTLYSDDVITFSLHYNLLEWMNEPLNYINCSKRGLTEIPKVSEEVEILDLSFNAILHIDRENLNKLSQLLVFWFSDNCPRNALSNLPLCMQRVHVEEIAFSSLHRLKMLNLANSVLEKFPKNLPPLLQFIDVSQTAISPISEHEVGYLRNLTVFVANDVCLDKISDSCKTSFSISPNSFLESRKTIKVLSLKENDLFKKKFSIVVYPNLMFLDLSKTRIRFDQFSFQNLTHLNHLQMQEMHPKSGERLPIPNYTFDSLLNLVFLDLSNNRISNLPDSIFRYNSKLTYLDLSQNCINTAVQNGTFVRGLKNLKYLYLGFNYCFSRISSSRLKDNQNDTIQKKRINVHLNLGDAYETMESLEKLSFGAPPSGVISVYYLGKSNHFNTVTNRSIESLKNLTKLRDLSLRHCQIQSLDFDAFRELSLTNLELSNNHFSELVPATLNANSRELRKIVENYRIAVFGQQISSASSAHQFYREQSRFDDSDNCDGKGKLDLSLNSIRTTHQTMFPIKFSKENFTKSVDLSTNIILTVRSRLFRHWPKVCFVDLRNNPINYIHRYSFSYLPRLRHVLLNNTQVFRRSGLKALYFLYNIESDITLHWQKGQFFDYFKLHEEPKYHYSHVKSVDLSNNLIKSRKTLESAFLVFPKTESISLRRCFIFFSDFSLKNKYVTFFDASENNIPNIPMETLKNMPRLRVLLLYKNQISSLKNDIFNFTNDLEKLDLSYNRISYIRMVFFRNVSKKFKTLMLRNNYITQQALVLFPLNMLRNLKVFDIRWNSFVCSCDLTKSFGWWLIESSFELSSRPGILPRCYPSLDYFGGCVSCQSESSFFKAKPLLRYCANKSCQAYQSEWLCMLFTGLNVMFLLIAVMIRNSRVKGWFAKQVLKEVVNFARSSETAKNSKALSSVFAFHACVLFDFCDKAAANWVDSELVPNLEKFCRITLRGRDDQCGMSPVKQMLLKIESSRKIIAILSKDYVRSCEGGYILSVLEYLEFQDGVDRTIIVTFKTDKQSHDLIKNRRKNKPWTVLTVPKENDKMPVFWSSLKTVLLLS